MTGSYDVVVIGAGPAGAVTARQAALAGASVLLVDKDPFPRPKVCGSCLNASAVTTLEILGVGHILSACRAVPLTEVRISSGGRSAGLRLPGGYAVSREKLDLALVEAAVDAGARFLPQTKADLGADLPDQRQVHLIRRGQRTLVSSQIAVVASGLLGGSGEAEPGSRIGGGTMLPAARTPAFFGRGTIFMATGRDGYVGLVRVEDDRLDVAAAFDPAFVRSSGGLGPAAQAILDRTGWPTLPSLRDQPWKGTPPLTCIPRQPAARRVFVVGDAAGYIEPFTGEGMAWAISSSVALAPLVQRAVERWDESLIGAWQAVRDGLLIPRQRTCRRVARVLRSPILTGIAVRLLSLCPRLAQPTVASINHPPFRVAGPSA